MCEFFGYLSCLLAVVYDFGLIIVAFLVLVGILMFSWVQIIALVLLFLTAPVVNFFLFLAARSLLED